MSVFGKDIFKWPRSQSANPHGSKTIVPLVTIANVDETANPVAKDLHSAAVHGRQRDLVKHLETGIFIDFPNEAGQTPLFCAALRGHRRCVTILLQNGANPNEKDNLGMTPVHAACLRSSLKMIGAMIEYGGDLRLHDNKGNTCIDWAKRQPDSRKRLKMLEFLQKSQLFALNYSGDYSRSGHGLERQPSILQMLRNKVGSHMSLDFSPESGLNRVRSYGFGKVYYGGDCEGGVMSVIPLITENLLQHDDDGVSFDSTSHIVMESMKWDMTPVTVKQTSQTHHRENVVDLLISEVDYLAKLRHPNILLLMGLCQSTNLDNLMLVFERVGVGSLHHVLYDKMERLPMMTIRDISRQVCDAMLYIHRQNFLHSGLSSHAVYLVSVFQAKLGNLEYMVERKKAEVGRSSLVSTGQHREQLYRWMAPELLFGGSPTPASDIYSYCCVLWEMIVSEMPWKNKTLEETAKIMRGDKMQLPTDQFKMPPLFKGIIERGLKVRPPDRPPEFALIQQWLSGPLNKTLGTGVDRIRSLQREPEERIRPAGNASSQEYTGSSESDTSRKPPKSRSHDNQSQSKSKHDRGKAEKTEAHHSHSRTERGSDADVSGRSSRATSDTNNHYLGDGYRMESLHGSWSSLGDSDSDEQDAAAVGSGATKKEAGEGERRYFWREMSGAQRQSRERQPRRQEPFSKMEMSGLFLSASQLTGQKRRSANLPWQGSVGLLRAGNSSPRLGRSSRRPEEPKIHLDVAAQEGDCRTLPLVKPASHSTDIKAFPRSDSVRNSGAFLTQFSAKSKSLERPPSASARSPRSRSPHPAKSRPCPASEERDELDAADLEMKHQGSVRSLAEQFQTHLLNHSLRQSILRGSMTPHGLWEGTQHFSSGDLGTRQVQSLTELPVSKRHTEEDEAAEKEQLTGSTKGSAASLTTVSGRDSCSDDDLKDEDNDTLDLTVNDIDAVPLLTTDKATTRIQVKSLESTSAGTFETASSSVCMVGKEFASGESTQDSSCQGPPIVGRRSESPRRANDDLSHRQTRHDVSPRKELSPRRNMGGDSPLEGRDYLSPQRSGGRVSPRGVREDRSPQHTLDRFSPREVKDDLSPRNTREDISPRRPRKSPPHRQIKRDLSPRRHKGGLSPRGPSQRQAMDGMSPRRSRVSNADGPFDFQEYYIDDDYSALCDEDPDRIDSICTHDVSGDAHVTSMRGEWMDDKYMPQDAEIRTVKTNSFFTESSRDGGGRRQLSPRLDDTADRVVEDRSLQSVSETADFQSSSIVPQRCIVLNLEKRGHSLEFSSQPSVDSLDSVGHQSVGTGEDDTLLEPVDESQYTSTSPRQTTLHKFYLGPNTCPGGFTTTLRVESSLQSPGSHHITHTARDQDTGVLHTVHEETVKATTLRTTLGIQ